MYNYVNYTFLYFYNNSMINLLWIYMFICIIVLLLWNRFIIMHSAWCIIVTGFEKTLHMWFFVKIEFDAYLTIELFAKSEADYALRLGVSALCLRSCHTYEKLRHKGVAMHAYSVSVYYAWTGNELNGHGWSRSKWMPKVKLGSNFIVDNKSHFFDA